MGTITAVDQVQKEGNQQDFMFMPEVDSSTESIDKLSDKYSFEYDTRSYKNVEDKVNGEDYYFRFLNPETKINIPIVIDGYMPKDSNEIAINTNFAEANDYKVGDRLKVNNKNYSISAMVVIPDYISPIVKKVALYTMIKQKL